ncbi:hypothetical protein G7K_5062-t1 [Saitoella complicata NRRL Y-17804]|uniref:Uncharacterized protein n=1 Tax=Saitoella complicata (strain BCRC 22490 / CBS 7301 / JCM 7358 / NBRC 10748 / NRRL Y-17804) TaxID=698492 RepID=A0A0E9NM82_SAICN|nr:hypothetical protein G7K_5062-t1 [Saitoella complicata NRRL Y-17804]
MNKRTTGSKQSILPLNGTTHKNKGKQSPYTPSQRKSRKRTRSHRYYHPPPFSYPIILLLLLLQTTHKVMNAVVRC